MRNFLFAVFLHAVFSVSVFSNGIHVVRPGDNLTRIAAVYGVSISDLVQWNALKSANDIRAGQKLTVRKDESTSAKLQFSVPVHGSIAVSYSTSRDTPNPGVWYSVRNGAEVRSAAAGKVLRIDELRGYGRYILIDHGGGWTTLYSHLDSIAVEKGSRVSEGQLLGRGKGRIFFLAAYQGRPVNPNQIL